ncbi:Uma2 family endonuclease [Synechococcales cyanobacterium C]|uniref:Uma2 family endonuclease n=1 Tax=Petrachloros mirabilis ULC683 TaxID=2781853 RepID=A0A8K2A2A3_9CYAN|nr:Uma2 family endonuclease [Petrachloros mirabilis]NCJ08267.1 Uma2 family endonuclease [Petrachloros mirabilis ULC683]
MTFQTLAPDVAQLLPEQRVVLEGVSWQQYELLLATLGNDFPALRLSYLEGTLEIMTTSPSHEELKKMIAMLMEAYFQETRTRFHAIGSATFRKVAKQRGLEPDECYCLGQKKEFPDLAIEVVLSHGLVDKLDIYRGLGVPEVWVWEAGKFSVYHLRNEIYEQVNQSELLPECNIELLANYVRPEEQFDAVMDFREALRTGGLPE